MDKKMCEFTLNSVKKEFVLILCLEMALTEFF